MGALFWIFVVAGAIGTYSGFSCYHVAHKLVDCKIKILDPHGEMKPHGWNEIIYVRTVKVDYNLIRKT